MIVSHLIAAAAAMAGQADRQAGEDALRRLLANRVQANAGQECLPSAPYDRDSQIVDGLAIVYRSAGSRLWVNRPRAGAKYLDQDVLLVSRSPNGRLCRSDIVDVVTRYSGITVATLQLGDFVPYDRRR